MPFRNASCLSRSLLVRMLVALTGLITMTLAHAQSDAKDCSDPAMFPTRIPNYVIASCKRGNDTEQLRWPGGQQQVMGLRSEVVYRVPAPAQGATPKYVAANYANAITKIGGVLLEDPAKTTLGDRLTARVNVDGKEVWVRLFSEQAVVGGNWVSYKLITVQVDSGAQVVSARKMLEALDKDGFITLYINFDTAKWDIKPDAQPTIKEITELLRSQPRLRLSVEGHTDNAGAAAANKTLSENRARAVMEALVKSGIEASRLKSAGYGQERPVADNRTEEGRAKNRRVELVKLP
ncbi:OmpA family protein [Viridibacterium curvum]|uniref:OmpA-like domain-containing protein n=1 Tax=Viridibacterium curvum TaxID=1101404 RepID=A0ABP9QJV2_9RHOO